MFMRRVLRHSWKFAFVGVGVAALASCRCSTPEKRAEYISRKVARHLDLNDEQQVKFDALRDEFLGSRKNFRAEALRSVDTLILQIKADAIDTAKINEIIANHRKAMDENAPKIIERFAEFHRSLSAEQKAKIAGKLERVREHLSE